MSFATAKIELDLSGGSLILHGADLSKLVSAMVLRAGVGEVPLLSVDIPLHTCDVSMEGKIEINGLPVDTETGRLIYESLRAVYEE